MRLLDHTVFISGSQGNLHVTRSTIGTAQLLLQDLLQIFWPLPSHALTFSAILGTLQHLEIFEFVTIYIYTHIRCYEFRSCNLIRVFMTDIWCRSASAN